MIVLVSIAVLLSIVAGIAFRALNPSKSSLAEAEAKAYMTAARLQKIQLQLSIASGDLDSEPPSASNLEAMMRENRYLEDCWGEPFSIEVFDKNGVPENVEFRSNGQNKSDPSDDIFFVTPLIPDIGAIIELSRWYGASDPWIESSE